MNRQQLLDNSYFQSFAGGLFFLAIFLPIRFVFFNYVSTIWYWNLIVISLTLVMLIYLTEKNKLGYLGKIVKIKLYKLKKSKVTKYLITSSIFFIYFESIMFYGLIVDVGNEYEENMTQQLLEQSGMTELTTEELQKELDENPVHPLEYVHGFVLLLILPFVSPELFGYLVQTVDKMVDYWLSHFIIVGLAESTIFFGFTIWAKFIKKF